MAAIRTARCAVLVECVELARMARSYSRTNDPAGFFASITRSCKFCGEKLGLPRLWTGMP